VGEKKGGGKKKEERGENEFTNQGTPLHDWKKRRGGGDRSRKRGRKRLWGPAQKGGSTRRKFVSREKKEKRKKRKMCEASS